MKITATKDGAKMSTEIFIDGGWPRWVKKLFHLNTIAEDKEMQTWRQWYQLNGWDIRRWR